jgi:uncharacterized protein (DUF58 family)
MKLQSPYWLGLIPLLLILQLMFPDQVWMALLVGMGGVWIVAYLWVRALSRNLHLEREMRYGWAQVGDILEERFTLTNEGWAPALWVEISDHSTLPGYHISQVTAIGSNSKNSWKTSQVCNQRGLFMLGPTRLRTGDPLGLFSATIHIPGSAVLMVMPPVVPLPSIEIAPAGRAGDGRRARPDPLERTVSTSGVRPYQTGDPLRWIHWPISAHHQGLYLRTFDSTPTSDWWIFLDLEGQVQMGEGWNSTEEHGVILAASLADRGLRAGRAVGLAANAEQLIWIPPRGTAYQRMEILRALALARPGNTSLASLLDSSRPALHRGASLIVITPAPQGKWLESLYLHTRGHLVPTVLIFDPVSYSGNRGLSGVQSTLNRFGITPYVIRREMMDKPETRPGHEGEWQWFVTGLGRAIPLRRPTNLEWKKVGG